MINKNKWLLVNNGLKGFAITFKQEVSIKETLKYNYPISLNYNLIDLRRINHNTEEQNLSFYFVSKKNKEFIFDNRKEALKYLFKEYPFLKEFKESIKE